MRKVTITKEMADFCRGILITEFARYFTPECIFAYKMISNNSLGVFDIDKKMHITDEGVRVPDTYVSTFYYLLEKLSVDYPVNEQKNTVITVEEINELENKLKQFLPYSAHDLRFDRRNRTASIITLWFTLIDHPIDTFVDTCLQKMIQVVESDIKHYDTTIASHKLKKYDAEKELTKLKELAKMAE
jgi:hypothetical protein